MIEIVGLVMPKGITMAEESSSDVVDRLLELMLCILRGLHNLSDISTISGCSLQWASVFDLKNTRYCLEQSLWVSGVAFLFFSFYWISLFDI